MAAALEYPDAHFVGTPKLAQWAIARAIDLAGVRAGKWQIPLEAIARYESNYNPYARSANGALGMMQLARGMFESWGVIRPGEADFDDPVLGAQIAIAYVNSDLEGYGGYGSIGKLLARDDRGPGRALRHWIEHPDATFEQMRKFYGGY